MHILAGKYKGSRIAIPKVKIRPTQDKVRAALFNILRERIKGADFLELYAGCGAVGIEALSCGAETVVFVENNRSCIRIIADNPAALGLSNKARLIEKDVSKAIGILAGQGRRFDIVFADPPYYEETAKKTLILLSNYDILLPNCVVICQHYKKDPLPESSGMLILDRRKIYGDTILSFYTK